jgi:hypothetical protein
VFSLIDGGLIAERIEALGIRVTGMHMLIGRPSIYALFSLTSQLRDYRPDVVHTWLYHADLLGGLAARFAGVRHVIWHMHNSDLSPLRVRRQTRAVVRVCAWLSYLVPSVIVSCSESGARPHIARVDAQKNHPGFFEAVRLFFERGGDADFLFVEGDVTADHWLLPGLRDATGRLARVVLAGPREDAPRIVASLDVLTSSSSGLPSSEGSRRY